ncbi:efflux transporter outer membrane subunit [Alkalilimnicola ehrlichii]|uniref:RND transporter n=1 Tax=Alkalilimnicola ehrlichii TaxID=351052 RepID=A0A3E0X2U8_9GAMM|nr:efflux transporter outer membrane subunit [Alkalilimnicola ehrlichii]RFA38961.1 hypothetical protein CAL65_03425 [Alkalilimnicola ehrlichii]
MKFSLKPLLIVLLASVLSACALTPEYQRPDVSVPEEWAGQAPRLEAQERDWWQRFNSEELTELTEAALANNNDLAASLARIDQARAGVRSAGATLWPQLDGSGSASRNYRDGASGSSDQFQLQAAYELDLFGRNRARREAADASLAARQYDHRALALSLQAEVASGYATTLALQERLALAERNLATTQAVLELVEARYRAGSGSALEVSQQRGVVANLESQLPALRQQLTASRHSLAVLLGRPPQGFAVVESALSSLNLPQVAVTQPAELLERRPDILRVEAELRAANADIGVARAAFSRRYV